MTEESPASSPEPKRGRSRGRLLRDGGVWTLIGLALVLFHRALFLGETFYFRDLTIFYLPQRRLLAQALTSGAWPPLWNPFLHGGMPFLADISNTALYPSQLLYAALEPMQALDIEIFLHGLFASLAAYALARALGFARPAGVVAGAIYAFCGLSLSRINLLVVHFAWPYLALVLLFWHRWRESGERRWFLLAASAGGFQVLAGGPEILVLTHLMTLLWLAVFPRRERSLVRDLIAWGALASGTALLAAVQLLPTAELVAQSSRGAGMDLAQWLGWSVPPQRLPELVIPGFFGRFDRFQDAWYWGAGRLPEGRPYLLSLYLGISSTVLALFGLRRSGPIGRRGRKVLGLLVVLSVALSLGRHLPGIRLVHEIVLPVRLFRFPVKALHAAVLPTALLAAQGMGAFREPESRRAGRRWLGGLGLALASLASPLLLSDTVGSSLLRELFLADHRILRRGLAGGLLHAAGILLVFALILHLGRRRSRGLPIPQLLAVVVIVDLVVAAAPVNLTGSERLLGARPETVADVRQTVGEGRLYRSYDPTPGFDPPQDDRVWAMRLHMEILSSYFASAWGIPVVGHRDFHGLAPRRAVLFHQVTDRVRWPRRLDLLAANGVTAVVTSSTPAETGLAPFERLVELEQHPLWLYRVEAEPGARWVSRWTATTSPRDVAFLMGGDPGFGDGTVMVEGGPSSVPADCPEAAEVETVRRSRESWIVDVDAECFGLLVLPISSYPGWKTRVDGERVTSRPANLLSTAVEVPRGRHRVTHRFEPRSVGVGAAVSLSTLLGLILWTGHPRWTRRRVRDDEPPIAADRTNGVSKPPSEAKRTRSS